MGNLIQKRMSHNMLDFKQSKYDNRDPTLSIQVASDLHIEFYGLSKLKGEELEKEKERVFSMLLTPSAPYLALLGDIGLPAAEEAGQSYRDLLAWCSQRWKEVWVLAGNHEFYNATDTKTHEAIEFACKSAGDNVTYMHKIMVEREGVRILGTCLWSEIPDNPNIHRQISMQLSDYKKIKISYEEDGKPSSRRLETTDTHGWHKDQLNWITEEIKKARELDLPVVVLSHHAPSLECSEPDIPKTEAAAHAFCSSLEYLFEDPVVLWVFGHTHFPFNERYGTTRVISNPAGYPFEHPTPYGKPYFKDFVLRV